MTAGPATLTADGSLTASDRQAAARDAYRASVDAGTPLTGAELGRRYGRTDRWGRTQISKARTEYETGTSGHDDSTVPASRDGDGRNRDPVSAIRDGAGTGQRGEAATRSRNGNTAFRNHTTTRASGSRDVSTSRWQDSAITLLVALVAAAASYGHMLDVALMAGEPLWIARAFPITVDGLVLAALRRDEDGRGWLALGVAVSVAGNVLAQFPEQAATAGPVVSAWPPLALCGTHRLLHGPRRPRPQKDRRQP